MLGSDVKVIFEEIIDDTVSDDLFYALLETADQNLRDDRDWHFLKTQGSLSRASGDTYATGVSLPADFGRVSLRRDAIRSSRSTYTAIDPDEREEYKDIDGHYFLEYDLDNEVWKIYFTGTALAAETVYISYQKRGTEITSANAAATNIIWPGKRGGLAIAWQMASDVTSGADGDEVNFRMSPEQNRIGQRAINALFSWDAKFKLRAINGRTGIRRDEATIGDNQIHLHGGSLQ